MIRRSDQDSPSRYRPIRWLKWNPACTQSCVDGASYEVTVAPGEVIR